MRHGLLLMLSLQLGRDLVIEGKRVPGEASSRPERRRNALERAPAVGPRRQVEKGTERTINQSGRVRQAKVAHVSLTQVEIHTGPSRPGTRLREHRRRGVDADDSAAGCQPDRYSHATVPYRKLD